MSTTTVQTPAPVRAAQPNVRLSFGRVVRSEAIKLLTLRSTWWSLGVTAALAIGISLLMAWASRDFPGDFSPVVAVTAPMQFTMLVSGILGAMAITGEYSTGMIRSTLTAEPRRGAVLAAKALVVGVLLGVTTVVTSLAAVVVTTPVFGESAIDWSDAESSLVPLAFGVLAMATFALLGLGWGFIIRNGAGAIAATVGILFVLPIVLSLFTFGGEAWAWIVDLTQYLPASAAQSLTVPGADDIAGSVLTLLAWPAATLLAGWAILRTRDA
ncbi:ABC transporter permease subunit [Microbacterium sp. cf332]|uniref:ABC transporter permease subunit n=1 Tax=Microbacterium sp. cf332 TaxID=1761804 RepID=UPI0008867F48|nr:ABC transporter permease subunit [Microbacterium sp. cf332]SDQ09928.1 ABC-2 type transport system permease protein [Microbacterium sp. cf332]